MRIPFNKPLVLGNELEAIQSVFAGGQFSGNGRFTEAVQQQLEDHFGFTKALLTTSCTSALELTAELLEIKPGDEVIVPSFAFITTANAFASRGAKVVFVDSREDHPSIDENQIDQHITSKTKAIVVLHYGGVACNMDVILAIANKHGLPIIEDNAQGIGALYKDQPLGGIGSLGALSFHQTKNIHCGEGGAIIVSDSKYADRSEVVWDMGTNRKAFKAGKIDSYEWIDRGGSYYPSELNAAFLHTQLGVLDEVNKKMLSLWKNYKQGLTSLEEKGVVKTPQVPDYANHNGHIFYLVTRSKTERDNLISWLKEGGVGSAFHFQSLHRSPFYPKSSYATEMPNADKFSERLVRLPLYFGLSDSGQKEVIEIIQDYFSK